MTGAPADFVVHQVGSEVVGIDGATGTVEFRGDAATVVQAAVDSVEPHDRILVRGDLDFADPLVFRKPVHYDHAGTLLSHVDPGEAAIVVGEAGSPVTMSNFRVGNVIGDDRQADAIRIQNGAYNRFQIPQLSTCRYAIHLDQASPTANVSQNRFEYLQIIDGKKGFYAAAPPAGESPAPAQANKLVGGGIFVMEEECVYLERGAAAGGLTIVGTIDNASKHSPEDAPDYVNELASNRLGSLLFMDFIREGHSAFPPTDVVLNPYGVEDSGILIGVGSGGTLGILPDVTLEREGPRQLSTNSSFGIRCDTGNYGGNFEGYTPPPGHDGAMVLAEDRDATPPSVREYVYSDGRWQFTEFTPA